MGNRIASLILGGASVAMALLGWWIIYRYLKDNSTVWTPALFFFGVYLVALLMLVIVSIKYASLTFVISLAPAFILGRNMLFFLILAGATAIFYLGGLRIKRFKRNSIELRLTQIIPVGYSLITTAICLALAGGYFFDLQREQGLPQEELELKATVPTSVTDFVFDGLERISGNRLWGGDPNQTVDDFLKHSLAEEAEKRGIEASTIPAGEIARQRNLLAQEWGVKLEGGEKMTQVFNEILNKQINLRLRSNDQQSGAISPFLLAVGLFLTLKAMGWFLRLPLILIAAIIFRLLTKVGLIGIKRKQVLAERV